MKNPIINFDLDRAIKNNYFVCPVDILDTDALNKAHEQVFELANEGQWEDSLDCASELGSSQELFDSIDVIVLVHRKDDRVLVINA